MNRLFTRSTTVKYQNLDKFWDFCTDPDNRGNSEKWYENFPENASKMSVPSCWNTTLGLFRYEGVVWYRTEFETESGDVYLNFEAVCHECDVYIDGKHIGYHYGGLTEFGFEAFGIGKGNHEIVVRVDNTLDVETTIPHSCGDWYNYGGICRSVSVIEINNCSIRDMVIKYDLDVEKKSANVNVATTIYTKEPITDTLKISIDGKCVYEKEITVDGVYKHLAEDIALDNLKLWDIYEGNLYYFTVTFGGEDLIDRTGFRTIEARGKDIYLNGKQITIVGVNRHEIHPDWGFTMPFELIKRDLDIIRDTNPNTIRTAHYPHSKKTYDYIDEIGLLCWEEIPVWGNNPQWAESLKNEQFINKAVNMLDEMIVRDMNHPSIVFWGMYNEIDTSLPQSLEFTKRLVARTHEYDTSRLTSYASCSITIPGPHDICAGEVDMVSFNYYLGWIPSIKTETFDELVTRIYNHVTKTAGREMPIMMSEFGCEGLKGCCTLEPQKWSENYQIATLKEAMKAYFTGGKFCGGCIWNFCNFPSQPHFEYMRPGGYNNKGLLDEYRRPKATYEAVKQLYKYYNPKGDRETKIDLY